VSYQLLINARVFTDTFIRTKRLSVEVGFITFSAAADLRRSACLAGLIEASKRMMLRFAVCRRVIYVRFAGNSSLVSRLASAPTNYCCQLLPASGTRSVSNGLARVAEGRCKNQ
jgi:hypothetical protein